MDLDQLIYQDIPLTNAMGLRVLDASEHGTKLHLPLEPNSNHKGTAFGGSIYSAAVLACWILVSETLKASGLTDQYIVIQDSTMEYLHPVELDFVASSQWKNSSHSQKFIASLKRKGLGRAELSAQVTCSGKICAQLNGRFVVQI